MKKFVLLGICSFPLLGATCPIASPDIPSIGVTCSNNLDASAFGFKLTVPADFKCTTVRANPALLVFVRYLQSSTKYYAAVQLAAPVEDCNNNSIPDATEIASNSSLDANSNGILDTCDGCAGDPICQEQTSVTTANNLTFRIFRVASPSPVFIQYLATTTIKGNNLGVSVSVLSSADSPALPAALNAIIESVELVP